MKEDPHGRKGAIYSTVNAEKFFVAFECSRSMISSRRKGSDVHM